MIIKPTNQEVTDENIDLIMSVIEKNNKNNKVFVKSDEYKRIIFDVSIIEHNGKNKISYFDGHGPFFVEKTDLIFF